MLFLVELDHVKSGQPLTAEAGRTFIEQVILPTLAPAEKLVAEKKILAGGSSLGKSRAPIHCRGRLATRGGPTCQQLADLASRREPGNATRGICRPAKECADVIGEP